MAEFVKHSRELYSYVCDTGWDYCFPDGEVQMNTVLKSIGSIIGIDVMKCDKTKHIPILLAFVNIANTALQSHVDMDELLLFLKINFSIGFRNITTDVLEQVVAYSFLNCYDSCFSIDSENAIEKIGQMRSGVFDK